MNSLPKIKSNLIDFRNSKNKEMISKEMPMLYNQSIEDRLKQTITSNNIEYIAADIEEENTMDNKATNDILLKYIDSLDKKYDDYKRDMIESENRIRQDAKNAEDRYEKRQAEFDQRLDERFKSIDDKFNKIEAKFIDLEDKIDIKFGDMQNEIKENNKYLKSLTITTNIGIAAMVISVVALAISMYFSLLPLLGQLTKV